MSNLLPTGGESSNTPHLNRQSVGASQNKKISGGEDTAVVGFGVRWPDGAFLKLLEEARKVAELDHEEVMVEFAGVKLRVSPGGSGSGGGKGTYYAFRFGAEGFKWRATVQLSPSDATPNLICDMGSIKLLEMGGLIPAFQAACETIKRWGGVVFFDKLSRVDMCADMLNIGMEEFKAGRDEGRWVCRAKKNSEICNGRKCETVWFGLGAIKLRIYDKLEEVKNDKEKDELFTELRWGDAEQVTRVEFQLRRKALVELGVEGVEDYGKRRAEIAAYLCEQWFRMTEDVPDRDNGNQARAVACELWRKVAETFQTWCGAALTRIRRLKRQVGLNVDRLIAQAWGCLGAVAACECFNDGVAGENVQENTISAYDALLGFLEWKGEAYARRPFDRTYQRLQVAA